MELRVLGPLEVVGDAGQVELGGRKARAVLALLAVNAGESVSEDRLIEALWGGSPPRTARKTLHSYVSRLRRALADDRERLVIETTPGGYRLRAAPDALDVARVEALAAEGRDAVERDDHAWAAVALRDALRSWRGTPLADFAGEPWAATEATRLEELRVTLLEQRVDAELACGRHTSLVPELESLTAEHPLREHLWGQRMLALYRAGRQAEALRVYQDLRARLRDELGIDPGHALRHLEEQILDQDRALDWTATDALMRPPKPPRRGLPTGVVTFLLTDIEGSTASWEAAPEAMAAAVAEHDALIHRVVESHGGAFLKSRGEGDSTMSAFSTAESAVATAVEIQQALDSTGSLRVRMGIHTGEAEERDGDYFGPTLSRAARLRGAAHGGQVICSSVTAQLLMDGIHQIELIDLGEHRLRDLARPDRVFQVGGGTFPPLRTFMGPRHNLPVQASQFIGREAEVEAIVEQVDAHRLVVLTGVGGVGKTRLAIEAAASLLHRSPGGVFFVDLAPVSDPSLIAAALANVLPIDVHTSDPASAALGWMAQEDALVVLDNCEHLVEGCADLLATFLSSAGASRVLATSREPFGLAGERDWQVPSLAEQEGRELFAIRAAAVRSSFSVDASNVEAIDEICRRLDGMPLAIELAAARVAHLHPQQIADRLNDRFSILTGGRGRVQRQHTLQAALDWSHDLLEPAERMLLRRLGVFVGTFSLEAVEGVCADDDLPVGSIIDLLGALVSRSLVDVRGDGRYRLLETVRLYAEQRLAEADESGQTRDRHLRWFLSWVQSLDTPEPTVADVAGAMDTDYDNIAAAVAWALTQGRPDDAGRFAVASAPMWMFSSRSHEASHWLRSALVGADDLDPDLRAGCYACSAHAGMMLMTDDVFDLAQAAVRVPGAAPSGPLALAWSILATIAGIRAAIRGDAHGREVERAVAQARSLHVRADAWRAETLNLCAGSFMIVSRYPEVVPLALEAVDCATVARFEPAVRDSTALLMVASHLVGEHALAMSAAERLLDFRDGGRTAFGGHEAVVLAADGQHERARVMALETLSSADEPAIPLWKVEVLINLGIVEAIAGAEEHAAVLLAAGRALGRPYGEGGFRSPMSWALYAHYLPRVRDALGPEAARRARDRGRAMSLAEAIEYAREEVRP